MWAHCDLQFEGTSPFWMSLQLKRGDFGLLSIAQSAVGRMALPTGTAPQDRGDLTFTSAINGAGAVNWFKPCLLPALLRYACSVLARMPAAGGRAQQWAKPWVALC